MLLSHFVARDSDTSLPILLNMTTFPKGGGGGGGSLSARPSAELLWGRKAPSEEPVVSPQTYKNNCFHVPESLAGPSDRGRMMEGCTVNRTGGRGGGGGAGRRKSQRRNQGTIQIAVTQLCSAAGSDNQPPAHRGLPRPGGRGEDPATHTERALCFLEQTIEQNRRRDAALQLCSRDSLHKSLQPVTVVFSRAEQMYYPDQTGGTMRFLLNRKVLILCV